MELWLVEFECGMTSSQFEDDATHAVVFGCPDRAFCTICACPLQSGQQRGVRTQDTANLGPVQFFGCDVPGDDTFEQTGQIFFVE
ncbi:MAG: hypothetical protein DI604_28915 [Delftia acidovorans]|nr:MAG: hypothetical protein DI604_28915 [Delftia acidovorans]